MSAEVKGMQKVLKELESRFGENGMQQVSDAALKAASLVFLENLKSEFSTFSDGEGYSQGYSLEEITASEPRTINGKRVIDVYWKGPHGRYRIIHLNEFGTIRKRNPPGKGAIARAVKNSEKAYKQAIKQAIERGL
ncbi:hypothetical protein [Salimicrobium album]|uniref:Bacteriophage HK97-gp10, tail-component n=1 Tax=Salimicrobium album TaxID=50717 RepID=A0A1H3DF84_9BACI|nr:hypothetical protein [Salimicrobium album]SDX65132.1 hypothetical protein SAMN04488081_0946 [Salimicrobium album]